MFYFFDITNDIGAERHIIEPLDGGGYRTWPLTDDNPNKAGLDEWLAKGNTLTEWNPTDETPGAS
jgi:hypothetical protein